MAARTLLAERQRAQLRARSEIGEKLVAAVVGRGGCRHCGRRQMHQIHHRSRTTRRRDGHHRLDEVSRPATQAAHALGEQQPEEAGVGKSSDLFGGECPIPVNRGCGSANERNHFVDSIDHALVSHCQLPGSRLFTGTYAPDGRDSQQNERFARQPVTITRVIAT